MSVHLVARPRGGDEATPSRRRRDVNMIDVARAAGVSHMTVSRVLNGSTRVSPDTRARVEEAMRTLGYHPNLAARALVSGRSGQLCVVFFDTTLFGPASALFAIEQAARREGYSVSIVSLPRITPDMMRDAVAHLRAQAVDGAIIVAPHTSAAAALREVPADLPAVVVGGPEMLDLPTVAIDQETGAQRATEYRLTLGHRTVWHIAGPSAWADARGRARGWRRALRQASVEVPPQMRGTGPLDLASKPASGLLEDRAVTAIFVANDHMALGALRALELSGRRVPGDVSIVGFDDVPESPYYSPGLTTIRQDFDSVGDEAVSTLLARIDGVERVRSQLPLPDLVIRASTARRS